MTIESLSRLRQGIYRFVGAGFSHPTPDLIAAAGGTMELFDTLDIFDYSFAPDIADAISEVAQADLAELSVAFVAIFEAGVGGVSCPPFETAYVGNPRTGDVATLQSDLKRAYLRFGLNPKSVSSGEVDHISTELHVMARLCALTADGDSTDRSAGRVLAYQSEFLDMHLLVWAPEFVAKVASVDRHPVYTSLSRGLASFLAHERQLVPRLVDLSTGALP